MGPDQFFVFVSPKPPKSKKLKLILLLVILLMMAAIAFSVSRFKPDIKQAAQIPMPKSKVTTVLPNTNNLFFVQLEYDPKTAVITQLKTGQTKGDPPILAESLPVKPSTNKIYYKVEVSSAKGEIINAGYYSEYKQLAQTAGGKLDFTITLPYQAKAIVRVYSLEQKLIWLGRME